MGYFSGIKVLYVYTQLIKTYELSAYAEHMLNELTLLLRSIRIRNLSKLKHQEL